MNKFNNYTNVFYDSASAYKLEEVNEHIYLIKLFEIIKFKLSTEFESFHFYILFSHNHNVIPFSKAIKHENKILFWFSEESGDFPSSLINDYKLIFKSYIKKEDKNVFSNPLGCVNEFFLSNVSTDCQKDISLFFSGNLNPKRYNLYSLFFLKKYRFFKFLNLVSFPFYRFFFFKLRVYNLSIKRLNYVVLFSNKFKSGLSYNKYNIYLKRANYVICPSGFQSNETFRHIEALANNCIVISEPMPDVSIYFENPFLIFRNKLELKSIINDIENNHINYQEIKTKHEKFYNNNFSLDSFSNNVVQKCKNIIDCKIH